MRIFSLKRFWLFGIVLFGGIIVACIVFQKLFTENSDRQFKGVSQSLNPNPLHSSVAISVEQFFLIEFAVQQINKKNVDRQDWLTNSLVVQGLKTVHSIALDNALILDKYPPVNRYTPKELLDNPDLWDRMLANVSSPSILIKPPRPCNQRSLQTIPNPNN